MLTAILINHEKGESVVLLIMKTLLFIKLIIFVQRRFARRSEKICDDVKQSRCEDCLCLGE